MPFCTQCGNSVGGSAAFCPSCGAAQPRDGRPEPRPNAGAGISAHTASILCYIPVAGWIACVWILAADRFRDDRPTRFHAFQGLYLFVAWLILDWGIHPFVGWFPGHSFRIAFFDVLKGLIYVAWVVMLIKTSRNEDFRLPIFGELADRSLSEQR